jgi:ribosomal protein S17E
MTTIGSIKFYFMPSLPNLQSKLIKNEIAGMLDGIQGLREPKERARGG